MKNPSLRIILAATVVFALLSMGAKGDGCSAVSKSPAPDVTGVWDITYDDTLDVTITVGGAVYERTLGVQGGLIEITHEGQPLTFDLDCERPEVICPSEAWPGTVEIEQRNTALLHQMIVTLPKTECLGVMVTPAPADCGEGTLNPDCDQVCDGEITVVEREAFGVIGETGETFRLYLGGGIATNGINCVLLAGSLADGEWVNIGTSAGGDWEATAIRAGVVKTGYAGGCLWAGDPNMDGQLEALVLSASIEFETGFTGVKR
ncbi:MAG: hypothetical protein CVU65_15320 [Deltaproteobacteria bacterium HGW-Deltaproteobacteria-22]|jgi:hypothetical protein|nr:MAG: hypothetical protein CVU65_15320 [Deltaproteobacteria bacterium HGW-Deltaproteobacteria-22]